MPLRPPLNAREREYCEKLRKYAQTASEDELCEFLRRELRLKAISASLNVKVFLKSREAQADWDRGFRVGNKSVKDYEHLARLLRKIRLRPPRTSVEPWDKIRDDSRIAIVLGERRVGIAGMTRGIAFRAVGHQDVRAVMHLQRMLLNDVTCRLHPELHSFPDELPAAEADMELDNLLAKRDLGGIIVVGSPFVNPLADPIARRILRDRQGNADRSLLPAEFVWAFPRDIWSQRSQQRFLSARTKCAQTDERISQLRGGYTEYPRTNYRCVINHLRKSTNGTSPPRKKFDDCGMILLDCRMIEDKILAYVGGHGGCGTIAASEALCDHLSISQMLKRSRTSPAYLGRDRVFGAVAAKVRKPTASLVDDLTLDSWQWVQQD